MRRLSTFTRRPVLGAALCVAASLACNDDPVRPQVRSLSAAEARWAASDLRDGYVITQTRECFCLPSGTAFSVTVVRDTITLVRDLTSGDVVDSAQWSSYRTVNQLFSEIRRAVATPGMLRDVQYDALRGLPTTVSLDRVLNAIDDEVVYRTSLVGPVGAR